MNVQTNLALLAVARGQYADAEPLLVECATLARNLGDTHRLAMNLGNLAVVVHARGDGDKAATLFEESLTLARDWATVSSSVRCSLTGVVPNAGTANLESAEASFVESLTIAGDLADPHTAAEALEGFAELAVAKYAPKRAATILGAAARLREEIGIPFPYPKSASTSAWLRPRARRWATTRSTRHGAKAARWSWKRRCVTR